MKRRKVTDDIQVPMSLAKPEEVVLPPPQDQEMREEQPSEVRNPEAIEE